MIDGKRPVWEFTSDKDIWEVVDLIIQETKEFNEKQGKEFDIESSVQAQLPFFVVKIGYLIRKFRKIYKGICTVKSLEFPPMKETMENNLVFG